MEGGGRREFIFLAVENVRQQKDLKDGPTDNATDKCQTAEYTQDFCRNLLPKVARPLAEHIK